MGFAERFDAESEHASLATRCQVAQIDKNFHGPVVALGQLGGHESLDLAPQVVLTADEAVEVLLPGDGRLAIAACSNKWTVASTVSRTRQGPNWALWPI